MPQVQPVANQSAVRAEIQRASARTGVDFDYLLGQAHVESNLDPSAKAPTSSASGLFQFVESTWLNTVQKHGAKYGLDWAAGQIDQTGGGPVVRDPAARQQILAMRFDPQISSLMAGEFASDNRDTLQSALGRAPSNTDLYLAHFLGAAGATSFIRNAGMNPSAAAASLFPKAAAANHNIFYDDTGGARSLAGVYGLFQAKLANAADSSGSGTMTPDFSGFDNASFAIPTIDDGLPYGGGYASFPQSTPTSHVTQTAAAAAPRQPSMAETLRSSFGLGLGNTTGADTSNVQKAYSALKAFNL